LEDLITEILPQPHAPLAAVCLARCTNIVHGLPDTEEDTTEEAPFLNYVYKSWFIHAQKSRDDPLTRRRLAEFAQSCHPLVLCAVEYGDYDAVSGPLQLFAYYNLPIVLAGPGHLRDPNIQAVNAETQTTSTSNTRSYQIPDGMTALCVACHQGSNIAIKDLLDLPNILVNTADSKGRTPLMWAVIRGHEEAARLLLARPDIEVNAVDSDGTTALNWALEEGSVGTAKLLLSHSDIDVNKGDRWNNTPLHHAMLGGDEEIVALLLAHPNVDASALNLHGHTALHQASMWGNAEAAKLLLSQPHQGIGCWVICRDQACQPPDHLYRR
jgi:ankyrin repeat protein